MSIICQHVHGLELRFFKCFPTRLPFKTCKMRDKYEILFWTCISKIKSTGITDKCYSRHIRYVEPATQFS